MSLALVNVNYRKMPKYGDSHRPDLTSVWVKLDILLVV